MKLPCLIPNAQRVRKYYKESSVLHVYMELFYLWISLICVKILFRDVVLETFNL